MSVVTRSFGVASLWLALTGGGAQAADFSFNFVPFYVGGGIDVTMVDRPPQYIPVDKVGAFSGTLTGANGYSLLHSSSPLLAGVGFTFCVELTQNVVFGLPTSYSVVDPATTVHAAWGANASGISRHIDLLMAQAMPMIDAAPDTDTLRNRLGALQLSIWEVIHDYSPSMTYSLSGGTLKFTADAAVVQQSSTWLSAAAMSATTVSAHYAVLHESATQDLLVLSAVPEPSTWALMASGLAALCAVARRRRRADARD